MRESSRMRRIRGLSLFALAVAACLAVAAASATAQTTGTIQGTVTDRATGRPINGAEVSVLGTSQSAATDVTGRYVIRGVAAGTHPVRAVAIGYTRLETAVTVAPGQEVTSDFAMSPTTIQLDEVVVTGTPGATEKRQLGNAVTSLKVAEIAEAAPVRTVQELFAWPPALLAAARQATDAIVETNIDGAPALAHLQVFRTRGRKRRWG